MNAENKWPKIPTSFFLIGAFVLCFLLYWPSLQGGPIWDDLAFWFLDPSMDSQTGYGDIWIKYNWPISASLQKLTFSLWGESYHYYHGFNLLLHFINAFLVLKVAQNVKLPYPKLIFLFFLIHPANVISVAWMIQLKTLLCFLFSILAFISFDKGLKEKKWLILAFFFFLCSLLSKSSSVTLPFIFFLYGFKAYRWKIILFLIPFLILSGVASYRLITSEVTQDTMGLTQEPTIEEPAPVEVSEAPGVAEPEPTPEITEPIDEIPEETQEKTFAPNFPLMLKSLRYYFWQSLLPIENAPVKGMEPKEFGVMDYLHLPLLILLAYFGFKLGVFWILLGAHALLLPYLGVIPAPYMNITWVSDQHLYLALPLLLIFWLRILGQLPLRGALVLAAVTALFYGAKTYEASGPYRDEVTFYEASLAYDPANVPIAYNLAESLASKALYDESLAVINDMEERAKTDPEMESSIYWQELIDLKDEVQKVQEN